MSYIPNQDPWFLDPSKDLARSNFIYAVRLAGTADRILMVVLYMLPFQIYQFLSNYAFFNPVKRLLNVYMRLQPGVSYLAIILYLAVLPALIINIIAVASEFTPLFQSFIEIYFEFFQSDFGELTL